MWHVLGYCSKGNGWDGNTITEVASDICYYRSRVIKVEQIICDHFYQINMADSLDMNVALETGEINP
jgi:hypothetical protein